MKVLQINSVYKEGSTGKITYDLVKEFEKRNIESVVCYGRGKKVSEPNVYKICSELYSKINNLISRFTGLMYGGFYFSTKRLIRIIKREKPDIVHIQCPNCYFVNVYKLITYLKDNNIKTVLTLHAEFMHTANCGHALDCDNWKTGCGKCPRLREETRSLFFDRTHKSWLKMKKAFDGFNNLTVVSVSSWLMERAKQSPILADKNHIVIGNGVDTDIFHLYDTNDLKAKHGLSGEKIIFHATPDFNDNPQHIKGGYYLIKLAEQLKNDNVKIFVAGPYSQDLKVPDNVVLLGRITDQELLAKYYSMADVTVLTSKKETFSMVVAESLCCGTPIVGFYAGAPERIAIKEYGKFVEFGEVDKLCNCLQQTMNEKIDKSQIANLAFTTYSKEQSCENYIQIYKSI